MSQHDYEPADVDDPATYSFALLWLDAHAQDPEAQHVAEQATVYAASTSDIHRVLASTLGEAPAEHRAGEVK